MGQLRSNSGTGKHFVHIPGNGAKRQLISGRVDVHYQGTGGYRSPRAGFSSLRSLLLIFFLKNNLTQCHFSQPSERVWPSFWIVEKAVGVTFTTIPNYVQTRMDEKVVSSQKKLGFL